MQQTKKLKLDFSAATILALITVGMSFLYEITLWILNYRDSSLLDFFSLYDVTFIFWFVACMLRNNKIAFRIVAIAGFAVRILHFAVIRAIRWEVGFDVPGCVEILLSIILILCALDVIKGYLPPTITAIGTSMIWSVCYAIWGFYCWFDGVDLLLTVLDDIISYMCTASIICYFLSQNKREKIEKRQEEKRNRQQIEQNLWQLKQYYDAKKISEEQYAYWKDELLKKL